jgi:predicted esterase YcpF (UPF0227 family)
VLAMFRYAYLHGFGSSPLTKKGVHFGRYFSDKHGITLHIPNLTVPTFEKLSLNDGFKVLDEMDHSGYLFHSSKKLSVVVVLICNSYSCYGMMRSLLRKLGEGKWRLIGSSLGGYTAARWAELHPDRVVSPTRTA